jgi:uncharacterized coiled-coil protein SlyX
VDAIPVREAATMVDRSLSSVRAYVRAGHIRGYHPEGANGANAPLLVSRSELLTYVASAGLSPAPGRRQAPGTTPEPAGEVSALRADLRAAELQAEVRVAAARLEALEVALAAKDGAIAALMARADALVELVDRERRHAAELADRLVAAEAELKALRGYAGLPWYQRLLKGPTPPRTLTGSVSDTDS